MTWSRTMLRCASEEDLARADGRRPSPGWPNVYEGPPVAKRRCKETAGWDGDERVW